MLNICYVKQGALAGFLFPPSRREAFFIYFTAEPGLCFACTFTLRITSFLLAIHILLYEFNISFWIEDAAEF